MIGHACVRLGMTPRKTPLGSAYYSTKGALLAYHPAKDQWFLNGGSCDIKVKDADQLTHLLIGLGVIDAAPAIENK